MVKNECSRGGVVGSRVSAAEMGRPYSIRARSLAPLEKTRGFGMTPRG
jgi:hypothetical protein